MAGVDHAHDKPHLFLGGSDLPHQSPVQLDQVSRILQKKLQPGVGTSKIVQSKPYPDLLALPDKALKMLRHLVKMGLCQLDQQIFRRYLEALHGIF